MNELWRQVLWIPTRVGLVPIWMCDIGDEGPGDEGGGGVTRVQMGAAPALRISQRKGSFWRPPHVRNFVKEGYFIVPRYEVWGGGGGESLTKYTRLGRLVTPEVTGLPSL